jgi:hypothetical protein
MVHTSTYVCFYDIINHYIHNAALMYDFALVASILKRGLIPALNGILMLLRIFTAEITVKGCLHFPINT